jgi:Fe-S cluster assembly protein SufD|tara:strand:- start:3608 stop:4873 length:1266 start_codon:yes stop_codon:yes gene_type:complete
VAPTITGPFGKPEQVNLIGSSAFLERRQEAEKSAAQRGMPSFEEELWRYTPIGDLDPSKYRLDAPGGSIADVGLTKGIENEAAAIIEVADGQIVSTVINDEAIQVHSEGTEMENAVGSVIPIGTDFFTDCNLSYCTAPLVIEIARNSVVASPILVRQHTTTSEIVWFPRLVVQLGENSEATVVEHQASPFINALVCPVNEIKVAQAARLKYLTVQEHGPALWQISTQVAEVQRDAHVALSQVALGGSYARARIDTQMAGKGSSGEISAIYFGRENAQHDFRTFQKHEAPHTNSNLLFKGVVDDDSRAIYTGLIRIEAEAGDVNAFQTNRTLKLSESAWAESVPNLEIENNDVKCSHASAVGPIDEEQKFYLESRGVPTDIAEALVVKGFFADVLEGLPSRPIAQAIDGRIDQLVALDKERL